MTAFIGVNFKFVEQLDENLQLSFAYNAYAPENNITGAKLQRTTKEARPHHEIKIVHPDTDKICVNGMNYFLIKGKIKVIWEWTDEDKITENDVKVFKSYHENLPCSPMFDVSYDMEEKRCVIIVEYAPHITDWSEMHFIYDIDSHYASIEFLSDDVELLCMIRKNNVSEWQIEQRDLLPNEEVTVTKSGTDCYIVNTNDVLINDTTEYQRIQGVMLTSDTAKYKNTSTSPQKIIKYYK